jgi:hypothetical protein
LTASNNSRLFSKYQLGLSYGRPVQSLEIVLSVVWMHSGFFVGAGVASAALRPWFGTHVRGLEREVWLAPHVECCEVRVRERTAAVLAASDKTGLVVKEPYLVTNTSCLPRYITPFACSEGRQVPNGLHDTYVYQQAYRSMTCAGGLPIFFSALPSLCRR